MVSFAMTPIDMFIFLFVDQGLFSVADELESTIPENVL
jgi:hypothetical protein